VNSAALRTRCCAADAVPLRARRRSITRNGLRAQWRRAVAAYAANRFGDRACDAWLLPRCRAVAAYFTYVYMRRALWYFGANPPVWWQTNGGLMDLACAACNRMATLAALSLMQRYRYHNAGTRESGI